MNAKIREREYLPLFLICLAATILILALMDLNSINPDEATNLFIGRTILDGGYGDAGTFFYDFMHRLPMIPSFVSVSIWSGIGTNGARILIPILFMNLLIITTYIFAKILYGRKEALIAALFLFTFPLFWRWGLSILTDLPLAFFSLLFLLFFYLGIERERKYLPISALALSLGLLLKSTIILFVIPAFLYLLITKRLHFLKTKEFILSVAIVPLFFLLTFLAFQTFASATLSPGYQSTLLLPFKWDISEIFKLVLAPSLIFSIAGLMVFAVRRRRQDWFIFLSGLIYLLFFILNGNLRLRYLLPLAPFMAMFAGIGFLRLRGMPKKIKRLADIFFVVIFSITFINALYMVNLEESTLWGAEELLAYTDSIEGNITLSTNYLPNYFRATSTKNIVPIPHYMEFDSKRVEKAEFMNAMGDTDHPNQQEYLDVLKSRSYTISPLFDYKWLKDNHIDYLVFSVYDDYWMSGTDAYYHPMFGPFEISFINRPYCNGRVPPDYQFQSDIYRELEDGLKYERVKEIFRKEQMIFIVYRLL